VALIRLPRVFQVSKTVLFCLQLHGVRPLDGIDAPALAAVPETGPDQAAGLGQVLPDPQPQLQHMHSALGAVRRAVLVTRRILPPGSRIIAAGAARGLVHTGAPRGGVNGAPQ